MRIVHPYSCALVFVLVSLTSPAFAITINHNVQANFDDGSSLSGMIAGDTGADLVLTENELTSWMWEYSGSPTLNPFVLDHTTDFAGPFIWDTGFAFINGEMSFASTSDPASFHSIGSSWLVQDGTGAFEETNPTLGPAAAIATPKSVASIPVPPALPLMAGGLGLIGLLGWRRKRKAVAA